MFCSYAQDEKYFYVESCFVNIYFHKDLAASCGHQNKGHVWRHTEPFRFSLLHFSPLLVRQLNKQTRIRLARDVSKHQDLKWMESMSKCQRHSDPLWNSQFDDFYLISGKSLTLNSDRPYTLRWKKLIKYLNRKHLMHLLNIQVNPNVSSSGILNIWSNSGWVAE